MKTVGAMPAAALAAIAAPAQKVLSKNEASVFEIVINAFAESGGRGVGRVVFLGCYILMWQGFVFSGEEFLMILPADSAGFSADRLFKSGSHAASQPD